MKSKLLIILALSTSVLAACTNTRVSSSTPTPTSDLSTPTTTPTAPSANPTIVNDLLAGGSSYSDPSNYFTFLYPNDYKLDTQDPQHIRISKTGPTQKGQTEMYDGVLIIFEVVNLNGKSLSAYVDERLQESPESEVTKPKTPITINSYQGYTYNQRGLGEFTTIILQKEPQSTQALLVTYLNADPGNLGFQQQIDATLSTIQLHK